MKAKRTAREKIILTLAAGFILSVGFVKYIGEPLYLKQKNQEQKIENKILFIEKYYQFLNQKAYYKEKEQANQKLSSLLAQKYLTPSQPALAAAGLQKALEDKAKGLKVHLVQVITEKPQSRETLLAIPIKITVKSTLEKLSRLIRSIENDGRFLVVEELVVRRLGKKEPELLESHLTVTGFIQPIKAENPTKT